jgi:Ca-activated chloride channel family protein
MTTEIRKACRLSLALQLLLAGAAPGAGLLIADGGLGGVLEVEEHTVHVTFNNGIVVTEVQQVFRNTENRMVEALYTFPVPAGASVADFTMWIGGREMVGEVVGKYRAREIYNSYKPQQRDPGLLEQTDVDTFEMRIFPIGPRAAQRVRIAYCQELDFAHDWATWVYPLKTASRRIDSRVRGRFELSLDVTSESPITAVESPSHRNEFVVVRHGDHDYEASLRSTGADLDRDVVVAFRSERPTTGLDLAVTRQPGKDGTFQLTFTAGDELEHQAPAMDYVFVLDTSGSMAEDGKLDLSRALLGAFLAELDGDDRFQLIRFNVTSQAAFDKLQPAGQAAREEALGFLGSQRARRGSVALEDAFELAYRARDGDRPLNVVYLSDDMIQRTELIRLSRVLGRRPPGTWVFCVGVGNEVNRRFLQLIAGEAGGFADFISPRDDLKRRARAFRSQLRRPVVTDLVLDVVGVGAYDLEPATLPKLFHGSPVRIYGRYRNAGTARVRIRAAIGGERVDEWVELDFPETEAANPELERMWAWHRVEALYRQAEYQVLDSTYGEIVRLGEAYSIVTEHTSLLVLENDEEFRRWQIERRNALRLERDQEAQRRLRERLEELRGEAAEARVPIPGQARDEETRVASRPGTRVSLPSLTRARPPQAQPPRTRQAPPVQARQSRGSAIVVLLALAGLAFAVLLRRN